MTNEEKTVLFMEMEGHLLNDGKPSGYFNGIKSEYLKEAPFNRLWRLKSTEQSPKHHPEGSVWNHTMLVIDKAAELKSKSKNPRNFMWAALLHDIGKPDTSKRRGGVITSYNHDKAGALLAEKFLTELTSDSEFIRGVCALVRWHMQILFVVKGMNLADIKRMKEETDTEEIALLGYCDRLGRLNVDKAKEEYNISLFRKKVGK